MLTADDSYRTPGQLIQELLDERGWTQRLLAVILNLDETGLNKIIAGKRALDAEIALKLGTVFGTPAEQFLELQKAYDLALARLVSRPDPALFRRLNLFGGLPISDMIKRGWLKGVTDVRDNNLEKALCDFFGISTVDEIEIFPHAAKKTNVAAEVTPAQSAWLYRVQQLADDMLTPKYSPEALRGALRELKTLLISAEAARKVSRIMAKCGVRYMLVEALPSTNIDGVCFWLDERSPVIGLSLRHDRIDNYWFILRHEIEHVLQRHGCAAAMLDTELEKERAGTGSGLPEEERIANLAAADFCVPQSLLERFIARKEPFFAERDILGFAKTLGVHPGLVAGQLQHRTGRYDLFRNHLVKIRSIVKPGATVDGWGDVAPVGA